MPRTVTWNGNPSTDVVGLVMGPYRKSLIGKPRGVHQEVAGLAGSHFWPEQPGLSKLSINAFVIADTIAERDDKVAEVANWFDYRQQAQLILSDRPGVYWLATIDAVPEPDEWRDLAEFELVWTISPYGYDTTPSNENISAGPSPDSGSFSIADDIEAFPVYEITADDGTIETFSLTVNGLTLSYQGPTIAQGNSVTINTLSDTVTSGTNGDTMLTGAYNEGNLVMGLVTSGPFPILQPGSNSWAFGWSGTATTATLDVNWRRRHN